MQMPSTSIYCLPNLKMPLILQSLDFYRILTTTTMDTAAYWLMAREHIIWNAAIASLWFWTEDLDPVTLGIATECVYTTFSTHLQVTHYASSLMKHCLHISS